MKVMLPNKNKKNLIVLSILAFVFLVSGVFLLWRVNQEKELSPGLSEAGGGCGACCNPAWGCVSGWKCVQTRCISSTCTAAENGQYCGCNATCQYINASQNPPNGTPGYYCVGTHTCVREDGPPSEGDCKDVKCEWPKVVMSHKNCACELCGGTNSSVCNGNPPKCTPPSCPTGYINCGVSGNSMGSGCTKMTAKFCWANHPDCNNPTVIYRYCKPEPPPPPPPPDPVCDGGNWDNLGKPSGVYPYCSNIEYSFVAKDSDGVDKSTIVVKVNGDVRVSASKTTIKTGDQEVRVKETLSTETNCLESGSYTITAVWKDKKGAGGAGTNCSLTTSFTVAEEIKNPDWEITKIPVESCIDDNTENPKAKLEYIITIENTGEGSGEILSVVDTLDSKVLEEYIDGISSNGEFSAGKISWLLTGTDRQFAPGQSKTYTYSYIVPKDAFGTYDNTVEAVPSAGNSLIANASIIADCIIQDPEDPEEPETPEEEEDLPGTGIFDDGQTSLILGFSLLFLGFTWRILGRGIIVSVQGTLGFVEGVNQKKREDRKRKFESKVIRDKK